MKPLFVAFIIQLSLMTAAVTGCHSNRIGELKFTQAPDFSLPSLDQAQGTVSLAEYSKGSPVLLVFWATWCPTCREEIPYLNRLYEKHKNGPLKILSVNVEEKAGHVRQFIENHPVQYPVLLDLEAEVAERYGLTGLPAVLVLAKDRKIVYYGFSIPKDLDELIKGDSA